MRHPPGQTESPLRPKKSPSSSLYALVPVAIPAIHANYLRYQVRKVIYKIDF